ncbi:hypothetical protein H5407_20990 [Mitsuaria sp. WAJ17]|uniref:hypothetical protein n=1 Tax=Mitsuaria sp. WAJ17 TaxID=2761452 RepID=UPI0015FF9439|nr:hypothetical protein [Mitsuaria sp. WAJ17]MBB2487721.1 hypothetical protein [Mitsuaria sp. WAJ17]
MKMLISMAMLATFASMAAASPDCTHAIPQLAGGAGKEEAPSAAGPRQQVMLGCDPGATSLLLPGVGVLSWLEVK